MNRPTILRWACLVLLPLAEVVWLSLRVDTAALAGKSAWWATAIGHGGELVSLLVAAVAACVVFAQAWPRLRSSAFPEASSAGRQFWAFLPGHAAVFAVFAALTVHVVEGNVDTSPYCTLWLSAWVGSGLAAALAWGLAAMPLGRWLHVVRRGWGLGLAALAIGAAALGAGQFTGTFWGFLQGPTFACVQGLLQAIGQETVTGPADFVLGTPAFSVAIAPGCSGYEGIGLIWVFLGAYLWLFRGELRFPQAYLLIPIGTILVWLANAVRIAALVMLGTCGLPQIALEGFHSRLGWLSFIAVALGLVAASRRMSFFSTRRRAAETGSGGSNPTAAYLAPLMALVAAVMITSVVSAGFDRLYPARVLVVAGVIWLFWKGSVTPARFRGAWSWGAVGIGCAVFVVWMGLDWANPRKAEGSAIAMGLAGMPAGWAAAWIAFRALGSVVTVPIAEELAFRGYLVRRLVSREFNSVSPRRFTWVSFGVSSALFGASHGMWIAGTLAGAGYAWAMYRRGRVADAIVAHAATNALIAIYVLTTQDWSLWA
jgi:exosortase E/protease (VPEID-CTERM system)